jgi:hypothetical protein
MFSFVLPLGITSGRGEGPGSARKSSIDKVSKLTPAEYQF